MDNNDAFLSVKYVVPKDSKRKPFYIIGYFDSGKGFTNMIISKGLIDYVTKEKEEAKTNEKRNKN